MTLLQVIGLIRVVVRLLRTANGVRIDESPSPQRDSVSIIVPTLNEELRIRACLQSLRPVAPMVERIIVSDGGSIDATKIIVQSEFRDVATLHDASPLPSGFNGKAWGLSSARTLTGESTWVLVIDADVTIRPALIRSLVEHANAFNLDLVSVATRQRLVTPGLALIHPSMLASLVFRYGIPGTVVTNPADVQANGQCMLVRSDRLDDVGGFAVVVDSVVEDVSLARLIAGEGGRVGLFETNAGDPLVTTTMYQNAREAWDGWSRSLPVRDAGSGVTWAIRMVDMIAVQGLWLPAVLATRFQGVGGGIAFIAMAVRFGTGIGILRAYTNFRWYMVMAPLIDVPVVIRILRQSVKRTHSWRGRTVTPRFGGPA